MEAYIEDCSLFKKAKKEKRNETRHIYIDSGINSNAVFNENQISVYPNPASDYLNINVSESMLKKELFVEIYDLLGKKIIRESIKKLIYSIDISKWNKGVYLIKISFSHENSSIQKRIIKR